jgi:hypothetical protein
MLTLQGFLLPNVAFLLFFFAPKLKVKENSYSGLVWLELQKH